MGDSYRKNAKYDQFFHPRCKKAYKIEVSLFGVTFLDRAASKFGSTVLEGFCDLSKILETSTSTIDKVHVPEITGPSVAGAQTNRLSKLASQFLPRSTCIHFFQIVYFPLLNHVERDSV